MKDIKGIAWDISWRDTDEWNRAVHSLADIFSSESPALGQARNAAGRMRELINAVDPFIQEQTAVVCPRCTTVCCIDRHGSFDLHDLVYAFCLELPVPRYEAIREETDPCRFLAPTGCILPRHERPFRCTWHFCDTLIAHFQTLSARRVREFNRTFQHLQEVRAEMLHQLEQAVTRKPVQADMVDGFGIQSGEGS